MGVPSVCHWVTAWTHCFLFSLLLNFFTHYFLSSNLINNINECFRKEVRVTFADWLPPLSTSVKPHCLKSLHSSELQAVGHGTFCLLDAYNLSIQVEGYVDGWSWWGLNKPTTQTENLWLGAMNFWNNYHKCCFVHILFFCLSYYIFSMNMSKNHNKNKHKRRHAIKFCLKKGVIRMF